jgi:hypothetical protein
MIDPRSSISWLLATAFAFGWMLADKHIRRCYSLPGRCRRRGRDF